MDVLITGFYILITGLLLGATYSLISMGLALQYGVARIMNLANGEMFIAGTLVAFWVVTSHQLNPYVSLVFVVPGAFCVNWLIYRYLLRPLVRRAKHAGQLEVDSILATFGMGFILVGVLREVFGGELFSYTYLLEPIKILNNNFALNRVIGCLVSVLICGLVYLGYYKTRGGMAMRAVAADPSAAGLVAIDVPKISALSFALGGAVTAGGGVVISTFLTDMDPSGGVVFTLKALIVVIMGGVGDVRGAIIASFILGFTETLVATLVDPGFILAAAYLLFVLVLLFRPQGLFGRRRA